MHSNPNIAASPNSAFLLQLKPAARLRRGRIFLSAARMIMFCLGLALVSLPSSAQVSGGSLSGTVTDPSGASVVGAKVIVTNRGTNISKTLLTNGAGLFSAPNIEPANYEVLVDHPGFSKEKLEVVVEIGRDSVLNIKLSIGAETQTVQVEATTTAVDLGSISLNQSVDGKTLRELPLNGRDFTSLAVLEPNVHTVDNQLSISSGDNTRSNRGVGTQISIGGTRPQQNNYRLDGMTTNDYSGAGPGGALGGTLGVDAVQEFSVVTSNATADYGRTSGGIISAVTRAGTNKVHASAYEFIRNSALDARNYFSNNAAPFKRNQFGGTVGGPVLKDKAFFFFNYEGLRQSRSTATTDTVPTALARSGVLNCVQTVAPAAPNSKCLAAGGTVAPSGSAGTQKYTVDPKVVPFLALFPLPNQPAGSAPSDTGSWVFDSTAVSRESLYTGRLDYTLSAKDAIHFTGLYDTSTDSQPDGFDFTLTGLDVDRRLYSLGETHIFSSNLINFARAGYTYTFSIAPASSTGISPLSTDPTLGFVPNNNVGELQISGLSTFFGGVNAEGVYSFHYHNYQAGDDLYWTKGKHSIQVGGSFDAIQSNDTGNVTNGFYTFGSIANFLTNVPTQFTSNIPGSGIPIYLRQHILAGYAQDNWHLRKTFSVTLGVRYETATTVNDKYGHLATLASFTAPTLNVGGSFYQNPSHLDFSPRVGFAWDAFGNGKTSVRAAYGIYDTQISTYMFTIGTLGSAPFGLSLSANSATSSLAGTFPTQTYLNTVGTAQANLSSLVGKKVEYVQQNPGRSYLQQYLLNVQQEIARNTTLEVGFTGSHGVRQPLHANDGNIVQPLNPGDLNNLVWPNLKCTTKASGGSTSCVSTGSITNPNVGGIDTVLFNESTIYDALNASLRRSTRNSRLGISYTWSKSLDESSSSNAGTNFVNSIISSYPTVVGRFRGLSDFNVQNNLVVNGLYTLSSASSHGFLHAALDGLQAGGISRFATGLPFSPLISGDQLGLSNNNPLSFPDRLTTGSCANNPVNLRDKNNYLRRECFAFPNGPINTTNNTNAAIVTTYVPRLGNARRNSVIGPGITTVDLSLVKNFQVRKLSDTARVEFRSEAFNVLNHPNFQVPSRTASVVFNAIGAPVTAPVLTATSASERQIQFGLKLIY